jgi:hypothetical protein
MKTQTIAEAPQGLARRAFLTGLAMTVPIAATIATPALASPDGHSEVANLIAQRDRWRQLDGQTLAFEDRLAQLEAGYLAIVDRPPAGLLIRAADFRLLKEFGNVNRWKGLAHFTASDIQAMRRRRAMRYTERFVGAGKSWKEMGVAAEVEPIGALGIDYDIYRTREPWPLAQRRKDSIVAAFDRWQTDKAALRASMGVDDAEQALEEHHEKVDDAVMAIVTAPATTIEALRFKAGLMAEWPGDGDPFEDWRKVNLMKALLQDITAGDA